MRRNIASLKGTTALVLGLGISGRAAARFLLQSGVSVSAYDDKYMELIADPEVLALVDQGLVLIAQDGEPGVVDRVVLSPGIPDTHPLVLSARRNRWELVGEIELACRFLPQRMVGVTGTNGKATVTLLIEHVLNNSGRRAVAVGNSGVPLSSLLEADSTVSPDDILVVELSSYQLETLNERCLDAAVLLNITPDHLDRYKGMTEYAAAKQRIKACLKPNSPFLVEENCAIEYAAVGADTYGYRPSCTVHTDRRQVYVKGVPVFSLPAALQGKASHDVESLMAAFAMCSVFGVTGAQFSHAYATFVKPAHRIEFVRNHEGVAYIDDSKGTNLDAVIRAVGSVDGNVILIAGGVDKGASYTPWIAAFAGKVRCICAIGQAAKKIEEEIGCDIPTRLYPNLNDAVLAAAREAKSGDTVLLSPGCSSFDMFKDYAHRGDEFKRIVQAL